MEKIIEKIFDLKKIPTKLFVLLAIISGALLFVPKNILTSLHLDKFEDEYGKYFGIIFLISAGIVVLNFLIWFVKYILGLLVKRKYKNFAVKKLYDLDPHEQAILREFFIKNKSSLELPYDDATVKNMLNKRILIRISNTGQMKIGGMLFPMKINDHLSSKIDENVLGTSRYGTDDEKKKFIFSNRPEWAIEIDNFNNLFKRI